MISSFIFLSLYANICSLRRHLKRFCLVTYSCSIYFNYILVYCGFSDKWKWISWINSKKTLSEVTKANLLDWSKSAKKTILKLSFSLSIYLRKEDDLFYASHNDRKSNHFSNHNKINHLKIMHRHFNFLYSRAICSTVGTDDFIFNFT